MINALYEAFPDTVTADGREYPIFTDFRDWLKFSDMLGDRELSPNDKLCLMQGWFIEPPEIITGDTVQALIDFYRGRELAYEPDCGEADEGEEDDEVSRPPVLDWRIDAPYIIGDFLRCYDIDLLTVEMHWYRFRILLNALPDDAQTVKRIAYRSADLSQVKNEAERKRIMRMKQIYALPFELDDEDIGAAFGGEL